MRFWVTKIVWPKSNIISLNFMNTLLKSGQIGYIYMYVIVVFIWEINTITLALRFLEETPEALILRESLCITVRLPAVLLLGTKVLSFNSDTLHTCHTWRSSVCWRLEPHCWPTHFLINMWIMTTVLILTNCQIIVSNNTHSAGRQNFRGVKTLAWAWQ